MTAALKTMHGACSWVRSIMAIRREMRDLRRLTDTELKDMGLNRTDVEALAKGLSVTRS